MNENYAKKLENDKKLENLVLIIFDNYPIKQDDLFNELRARKLLKNEREDPFWKKLKTVYAPLIKDYIEIYIKEEVKVTKNHKAERYTTKTLYWDVKELTVLQILMVAEQLKNFDSVEKNDILQTKWAKEHCLSEIYNIERYFEQEKITAITKLLAKRYKKKGMVTKTKPKI